MVEFLSKCNTNRIATFDINEKQKYKSLNSTHLP